MTDLPFADSTDAENAGRGFVAALTPCVVRDADGRVVYDGDSYGFLDGDAPSTVDRSLWRQSRLCAHQGLYEVTEGVYQVRGLDISNMTLVEGEKGVVVVDPLISTETAAAALALYHAHRGDRPVVAVIYTHSHLDHFGGVEGVVAADAAVPILAPQGFLENAVAENVYAGAAMNRRSVYMYGAALPTGPDGQVGCGLGQATSRGTVSLRPPTVEVTHTGQEETLDGVRFVFQLTPGTEAPAEMNFFLPDRSALCVAENATHTMHNVLTLRGALVRDARVWSRYLSETLSLFGDRVDVVLASHHWPTWGRTEVIRYLTEQRDLYAYLHDQTLRLTNAGLTGTEIAEVIALPPALERAWHARGYYGSVSHNVKAIYQRYMGWFDGNPASLWEHPPAELSRRWMECLGGTDAALAAARRYVEAGDLRFAATLLNHAVFADPEHTVAREELAGVYQRLGQGSENATWRNIYLTGAQELRHGISPAPVASLGAGMMGALSVEQVFDSVAVRVDGPRAWSHDLVVDWHLTDLDRRYRTALSHGALVHFPHPGDDTADLTVRLEASRLLDVLAGNGLDGLWHTGDLGALRRLLDLLDDPPGDFPLVTPPTTPPPGHG